MGNLPDISNSFRINSKEKAAMKLLSKIIKQFYYLALPPSEQLQVPHCLAQAASSPVNHKLQESNPERIIRDAKYAIDIARSYVSEMPDGRTFLANKEFVELGPGVNFGTALVLLSWGASKATVSDRFLSSFQADYHVPVYQKIMSMLRSEDPDAGMSPFEEVISGGT